eukprot:793275-Prymnesium_polylepis.1
MEGAAAARRAAENESVEGLLRYLSAEGGRRCGAHSRETVIVREGDRRHEVEHLRKAHSEAT